MKPLLLTLICSTMLAADAMKLPDVEPPKIKLPEGWEPKPEPVLSGILDMAHPDGWTGYITPPVTTKHEYSGNITFVGRSGVYWLTVHPGEPYDWSPEIVLIESKNEPVVTKIGDRWVIRFKL